MDPWKIAEDDTDGERRTPREQGDSHMVLIALPHEDFDPTEVAVPWNVLRKAGREVKFATPAGKRGKADHRVLTGRGFGPLRSFFMAEHLNAGIYGELETDDGFKNPIRYAEIDAASFEGLLLPGGHAPGMKEYLESEVLQRVAGHFFEKGKPVGAICHGVIVLARSRSSATGRSVLFGRRTTALPRFMEAPAYWSTRLWLGDYFRTYRETVQDIVTRELEKKEDFVVGPRSLRRDSEDRPDRGFSVVDGKYISARWPGDAHRFATGFLDLLGSR